MRYMYFSGGRNSTRISHYEKLFEGNSLEIATTEGIFGTRSNGIKIWFERKKTLAKSTACDVQTSANQDEKMIINLREQMLQGGIY